MRNTIQVLCTLGIHLFPRRYYEPHDIKIDGNLVYKEYPVRVKECRICRNRWHHMMPRVCGTEGNWKLFSWKPGETLELFSMRGPSISKLSDEETLDM